MEVDGVSFLEVYKGIRKDISRQLRKVRKEIDPEGDLSPDEQVELAVRNVLAQPEKRIVNPEYADYIVMMGFDKFLFAFFAPRAWKREQEEKKQNVNETFQKWKRIING